MSTVYTLEEVQQDLRRIVQSLVPGESILMTDQD